MARTSIFEEGSEVKSFEDNFKNLKANWERIINHADFEILSCDYAYTFKNKNSSLHEKWEMEGENFCAIDFFRANGR